MNDQELQALREMIAQEIESNQPTTVNVQDIVRSAVQETLISLGVDAHDPLQVQQDLAFLRDLRKASDTVKVRGMVVLVGILVTALAAATWLGIKAGINS
tara:strand:- start:19476 stop:19775 length:300 start_codon:yes stop_codon:yes gene_type:complete